MSEKDASSLTRVRLAIYRDYKIALRWVRLHGGDFEPIWDFDERDFNSDEVGAGAVGNDVVHRYLTSSWGKTENGLGLGGGGLPAYQVKLFTFWGAQWRERYEECKCTHTHEECEPDEYNCKGPDACSHSGGCNDADEAAGCHTEITYGSCHDVCDAWDWDTKDTGWGPHPGYGGHGEYIDLHSVNPASWPDWFYTSRKVMDVNEGVARDVLPVPIIEVQSIIR